MKTKGIDYGNGKTNINHETRIRYGVISQNEVLQAWADDSEPDYGNCRDYECIECGESFDPDCSYGITVECPHCQAHMEIELGDFAEPESFIYERDGYKCTQDGSGDIFILESPYYTFAQFCSPCAPGACYLMSSCEPDTNNRAYCFGHDWFEDGIAPYPVYDVKTGELVDSK